MIKRLLTSSIHFINIAVVAALISSIAVLIYGAITAVKVIAESFRLYEIISVESSKAVSIGFIEVIDLLLLGIVLYIIALGLYHLFIDNTLHLPKWLRIEDFEELKIILISVVVVLLAITFTGAVAEWNGNSSILFLGGAVGLVIASIGWILYVRKVPLPPHDENYGD